MTNLIDYTHPQSRGRIGKHATFEAATQRCRQRPAFRRATQINEARMHAGKA